MAENQKFLDSVQGHLNQFTSAYQALAANTIDSSAIKTVVDMGTGVIKLVDALHLIPAAIAGAGIFGAYHGGKAFNAWIKTSIQNMAQLGASLKALKGTDFTNMSDGNIDKIRGEFEKLDMRQINVVLSTNKVTDAQAKAILTALGYSEAQMEVAAAHLAVDAAQNKAADGAGGISSAMDTAGEKVSSFKNVLGGVKQSIAAAFSANPIGMTASVIIGALTLVYNALEAIKRKNREAIEEGERLLDDYQSKVQSIDQDIASIENISSRFEVLRRGVSADHHNVSLSTEEYAEYKQILEQIVDLNPSLMQGYDEHNQAIIAQNINIEEQIHRLKDLRNFQNSMLLKDADKVMKSFDLKVNDKNAFLDFNESLAQQMNGARVVMKLLKDAAASLHDDGTAHLSGILRDSNAHEWLSSLGLESNWSGVFVLSPEDIKKIRASYEALTYEISQEVEKLKPVVRASFQLDVAFAGGKDSLGKELPELSDTLKSSLMNVIDNVSDEVYQSFGEDDDAMTAWFKENFLYPVAENADRIQETLEGAFDLDRSLMTGEMKVKDYLTSVGEASAEMWSIYSAEQRAALEGQNIDIAEVFGFGTYAEQAKLLADGITEVVGSASLASEMLGSLKFTELEKLHGVLQEMKADGENVREFAALVMKAYGDPAFAENLQTLREQLDSGSISQTTFNQKLREMAAALGFTGPALERFVDAFADAPQQIENFDDFLDGIQDKIKKLNAVAEGAEKSFGADELIDFVQAFGDDLNDLNIDFNDVTAGNIQSIVQQIKDHSINRKLNEIEDHYESVLIGLRDNLDELSAQIESETDSDALDGLRARQDELQDAIAANQSLMTFWQGAVEGLVQTDEAAYSLQNTLAALSSAVSEANGYFDEYNKNGFLSLDSVQKLLEAHPNYVRYLVKEGDQYKLNQAALDDLNRAAREAYEAEKKAAEEAYQAEGEALKEKKSELDRIYSAAVKTLDAEIERLQKINEELGKELEQLKEKYAKTQSAVLRVLDDEIDRLKEQNDLRKEQLDLVKDRLEEETEKYKGAQSAVVALLDRELQQLKERLDLIGKAAEAAEDDAGKAHAAVLDVLERQKEQLEEQKDLLDELYQPRIDAIQAEIDKLSDANDERKKAIRLEKAKQELERARNQKTVRIYREGEGFVYESDTEAISSAQEELRELEFQEKLDTLHASELLGADWEKKILSLRLDVLDRFSKDYFVIQDKLADTSKEEEANQKRIDMLEAYREKWASFIDDYEAQQDRYIADQILGAGWEQDVLAGRMEVLETFQDGYLDIMRRLNDVEEEKRSYEERIELLQGYKEAWADAVDAYEDEQDRLAAAQRWGADWEEQILSGRIDTLEDFRDAYVRIMEELAEWEKNKPDFPDFDDSGYDWDDDDYDYDDDYGHGGGSSSSKRPSSGRGDGDDGGGGMPRVGQSVTVRSGETHWASGSGGVRMHDWVPGSTFTVMQVKGSQVLIGRNGQWTGWVDVSQLKGYRKGTLFASAGPHVVDEAGTEILVRGNPAQGRVASLEAGDGVVPNKPTQNLMNLAEAAPDFIALQEAMKGADFDAMANEALVSMSQQFRKMARDILYMPPAPAAPSVSISIGDVHVSGVGDPNGLAKAIVNKLPNAILQEIYRR